MSVVRGLLGRSSGAVLREVEVEVDNAVEAAAEEVEEVVDTRSILRIRGARSSRLFWGIRTLSLVLGSIP